MDSIAFLRAIMGEGLGIITHGADKVFGYISQFEVHRIGIGTKLSLKHFLKKLDGQLLLPSLA
jgi:hypothetical protein